MRNLYISENKRVLVNELEDGKFQIVHKGQGSITLDEKDFFGAANTIFEARHVEIDRVAEPDPPTFNPTLNPEPFQNVKVAPNIGPDGLIRGPKPADEY